MLHADQLRSKMLCRYPTLLHWRLFLYSATWMTWFIHSNLPFKPVSTRHHRLFDAGWWHIHFSRPWHQCLSFIAAWYHLQILATRSVLTGGVAGNDGRDNHPHAVIHDVSVCVSAWHLSFIEGSSGNEKFWHILTIYFFCGMNFPARGSLRVKRPFPEKMGNVQIVQKMPVGWACNVSHESANWGSGSQNTANILTYPWPSVWYAYRYRILRCKYHCIHPKIYTFISNIHIIQIYHSYQYLQPGVQKITAYLAPGRQIDLSWFASPWAFETTPASCGAADAIDSPRCMAAQWACERCQCLWKELGPGQKWNGLTQYSFLEGALVICCFKGLMIVFSLMIVWYML